ncbi:cystathionine beta-lyase [Novosphingobium album (ex Liu et al. 2023)]|uniref:Cystathionine beta-lyase n=1 Tax=Novosphingobium album (ex Liu et al. 2023) TaxID=3031130 RepID=A0ABT5WK56_9SPHN|nr:cystathionine beta-lyase [Novosphingobium album (ex Liu et al. 2023)]MDE8650437.1 cystathionine beta-lyase [Novosphingobium album (ex Liu et al. 2023)]
MSEQNKTGKVGTGTRLVGAGRRREWTGPVVNPPVWRASTHLYENMAALAEGPRRNEDGRFFYGRRGAPTQWALADALTGLEPGAAGTVLYPSGVAAIAGTLLTVLRPGDVLLMTDNAYDPSRAMGKGLLADFGIETRLFDPFDHAAYRALFCDRTRAVLLETPGSLTMEVPDVPALAAIAREHGALSVLDNTWAGPTGFAALAHGIDITVMALTKHVGGHSDLMMGSASAGPELYEALRKRAQGLGIVVSPDDAALALRGLRTLELRLNRETSSALEIASWLAGRDEIARVLCPMLPGAPGHEIWRRDFAGGCGLFSFVFRGGDRARRDRFIDALELFGIGYSWGGFESLAVPVDPAPLRAVMRWPPAGLEPGDRHGVRLAIGLEDPADLIVDIAQALAAAMAGG